MAKSPSLHHLEKMRGFALASAARSAAQSSTPSEYNVGRDALAVAAGLPRDWSLPAGISTWPASNQTQKSRFVRSNAFAFEDNRTWSPEAPRVLSRPYKLAKQYRTLRTTPAKITYAKPSAVKPYRRGSLTANGIQFRAPSYVILCIRRKRRRSAIMASGRGGAKHKRARFNYSSQIWC